MSVYAALLIDGLLLAAILFLGFLFVKLCDQRAGFFELFGAVFPIGAGFLTWMIFVCSWLGVMINRVNVILIALGLISAMLFIARKSRVPLKVPFPRLDWKTWGIFLGVGCLASFAVAISILRSYYSFDAAAIWSVKGYGIVLEGTVFAGERWGAQALGYPLNVPIQIGLFKLFEGDIFPGSKILFPMYGVSIIVGSIGFWLENGIKPHLAGFGAALLLTIPLFYIQSTWGYANVPLTVYLVLGLLWSLRGISAGDQGRMVVAGTCLGLASWTREEGVYFSIIIIGVIFIVSRWIRVDKLFFFGLLAPFLIISVTWLVFFSLYRPVTDAGITAVNRFISSPRVDFPSIRIILSFFLRSIFDVKLWGFLFPVGLVISITRFRRFRPNRYPINFALLLAVILTAVATGSLFYLGASPNAGFSGWVSRGFPRAFLPTATMFGILAVLNAEPQPAPVE